MFEVNGNKCGKCQNHDAEVLKKGHARECPFKCCKCGRCRLLDARSDILQVISGKETTLKGTKKDPHCGFCQNHGVKILRKGHVRSCGFGQERHFRLDNCFDCEVHYIRNEVNRLQIKMRRAMKEDKMLSEEQRKAAREPISRDEVEKVCDMARIARLKREQLMLTSGPAGSPQPGACNAIASASGAGGGSTAASNEAHSTQDSGEPAGSWSPGQLDQINRRGGHVWRPWSHQQQEHDNYHQQQQQPTLHSNNQQQQQQQQQQPQPQRLHQQLEQQQQQQVELVNGNLQQAQQEQQQQLIELGNGNLQDQFNGMIGLILAQIVQLNNRPAHDQ